jgi:hypothetical protein
MAYGSTRRGPAGWIASLSVGFILLIVELILTMLIYTLLNLYALGTFGYLVRLSDWVREILVKTVFYWLPGQADTAYATLLGELGPKAILLLLIGLTVAGVVRGISAIIARAISPPRY